MKTGSARVVHTTLLSLVLIGLCLDAHGAKKNAGPLSVTSFGTKGNGETLDTAAVQRAIDAAAERGGATVYFPPGTYLCGSLHMKTGVTLDLDAGATIKGSLTKEDYDTYETLGFKNDSDAETSFFHYALIWGENVERVGIVGRGTVDGNRTKRKGPKPIAFKRCKDVTVQGITIRNGPNYSISLLGTDYVNIEGVKILNAYCDGIDPDCCHNVRISNCTIESRDDCIVPKTSFTLGEHRSTEDVVVTNCLLATPANAFKLGTESGGDFKRIAVSNCVVYLVPEFGPAASGISLLTVDGSNIDGVTVTNFSMTGVLSPVFLRLGNRGRDMATPTPGTLKNVVISNIVARDATLPMMVVGLPDHPVEGVTLSDIRVTYKGLAKDGVAPEAVPEIPGDYPEADMFEVALPAYGFYARHADGLRLRNVQVAFEGDERRTALLCEDVRHLDVDAFTGMPSSAEELLRFVNVRDAFVRGCAAPENTRTYLAVSGDKTQAIALGENDFRRAGQATRLDAGVNALEVRGTAQAPTARTGKR